jgi:putative hemolysin
MEVFIIFVLILVNALFVTSEIALVSARKSKLDTAANKGDERAKAALDLAENPEKFLSTAQVGITLISILTGMYSGEKFSTDLAPFFAQFEVLKPYAERISFVIIVALVTFASIVFGELIPKRIGMLRAERIAKVVARPMNILSTICYPIVWLLNGTTGLIFKVFNIKASSEDAVTEEEIKAMITEGSEHGTIEEEEKEIIERVFHLGDRSITSLMTHRTDIEWIDCNDTVQEAIDKLGDVKYSTYPACEGTVDTVKGLVLVKDMLKAKVDTPISSIVSAALFVPENNTAYQLLEKFKSTKIHSCFIINEYGTLEGMITLNDILEAIVGDVPQEDQDEYEIVQRADGSYLVDAQLPFYDFLRKVDKLDWIDEDEQDFDTMAGFVLKELERIPKVGETFIWRSFNFEILDMDGQRIDKILATNVTS